MLSYLPVDRWVKIQEQRTNDGVYFRRQIHGGSTFDTRRGRLILFGSDTHGKNWTNTPFFFDLDSLRWEQLYTNDKPSTYRINALGHPVAGSLGNHPWAMHTFGAVCYDTNHDQLVVSSYPAHMEPGRFTDALSHLWSQVAQHPTWVLNLADGKWQALEIKAEHFFPFASAYDTDRNMIIGYKASGIYELDHRRRGWRKILDGGKLSWHLNVVYDNWNKALIVFGSHEDRNDVVVYVPKSGVHRIMPTPGVRPPKDQHNPMAFHQGRGETVVLVDYKPPRAPYTDRAQHEAQTWLYDLKKDSWRRIESATLPFGVGMNFNMEYDPIHGVLLLVTNEPEKPTAVWGLRLN